MSLPAFTVAVAPCMRANLVMKCKSLSPNWSALGTTASTLHAAAHSLRRATSPTPMNKPYIIPGPTAINAQA
ncbi:Uncharacterised protein [Pandoraea pulmonicola]|uniref:Uncharacterized protein n=1 Tax=Pandoraea pulmonicola TaxID=93221 RepID=A0AAJ4ZET4_PANPU|nr:Uncharacterised protein [Pandoraea pulmonicola]